MNARLYRVINILCALQMAWTGYEMIPLAYHAEGLGAACLTFCAFSFASFDFAERAVKSYAASLAGGPLGGTAT